MKEKLTVEQKELIKRLYVNNNKSSESVKHIALLFEVDISTVYRITKQIRENNYSLEKIKRDEKFSSQLTKEQRLVRYIGKIIRCDKHKTNHQIMGIVCRNLPEIPASFELVQEIRKFVYGCYNDVDTMIKYELDFIGDLKEEKLI